VGGLALSLRGVEVSLAEVSLYLSTKRLRTYSYEGHTI